MLNGSLAWTEAEVVDIIGLSSILAIVLILNDFNLSEDLLVHLALAGRSANIVLSRTGLLLTKGVEVDYFLLLVVKLIQLLLKVRDLAPAVSKDVLLFFLESFIFFLFFGELAYQFFLGLSQLILLQFDILQLLFYLFNLLHVRNLSLLQLLFQLLCLEDKCIVLRMY